MRIGQIDDKIRGLQRMRDELMAIGRACGCGDSQPACLVLEQLERDSPKNIKATLEHTAKPHC